MPFEKVEFSFPDVEKPEKPEETVVQEDKTPAKEAETSVLETDLEVEVVDDTPPKDRGRKPAEPPSEVTEDELSEYSDKVRKRIQHFSRGYHDERRKAEAAQRERDEAAKALQRLIEENQKLKESNEKSQAALIEQAKARSQAELEQAKRAFKQAYDSGDSEQLANANENLTSAKLRAERIANLKPLQQEKTPVQPQVTAPEPVMDPKLSSWQKENPWFGKDDEMTGWALGLHQKLVREGIDPQSDDYYDRINRRMRQLFPDRFESEDDTPAEKPRRSNVVAPATRSVAPKKVVLTESQVKLAKRLGLTPEQYARQVAIELRNQNG